MGSGVKSTCKRIVSVSRALLRACDLPSNDCVESTWASVDSPNR
jgi:hypothetical protein